MGWRNLTLRSKLLISIMCTLAVVDLFLIWFLPTQMEAQARRLVESKGGELAHLLAGVLEPALEFDHAEKARERLAEFEFARDVVYVVALRADGTPLAQVGKVPAELAALRSTTEIRGTLLHVASPITTSVGPPGRAIIGFTLEELRRERARALWLVGGISAFVLVLGFVVSWTIGTLLVRPLRKITTVADQITGGVSTSGAHLAAEHGRADEVGQLARALSSMLGQLERQRTLLTCQSEASSEGILIVSNDGEVLASNRRLREIWGMPSEGVTTTASLREAMEAVLDPSTAAAWLERRIDSAAAAATEELTLADGRVLEVYGAPVGDRVGRGWYFRDVTEKKRALGAISALNDELSGKNAALGASLEELRLTQRKLVDISRQAGMAEVATGVLHNVGNVLNGLNVSIGNVEEILRTSRVQMLTNAATMIASKGPDLGRFLTEDPKGKLLPPYLVELAGIFTRDRERQQREITEARTHVEHIKTVVSMQQRHARSFVGVVEEASIRDLVEDAVRMNDLSFEKLGSTIERDYDEVPPAAVDRHVFLQILLNLLSNARHALQAVDRPDKKLSIRLRQRGSAIRVEVSDNGVGIAPEHLQKLFVHGFTTKANGHGFGLHASALAAKQLGGSLEFSSEGAGKGATFVLEFPVAPVSRKVFSLAPRAPASPVAVAS